MPHICSRQERSTIIAHHVLFRLPCQVHVVASLPCYSPKNVNMQRGSGVFDRSIKGLMKLNALGYGQADSGLKLDLVYNPVGGFLPPEQVSELHSRNHQYRGGTRLTAPLSTCPREWSFSV